MKKVQVLQVKLHDNLHLSKRESITKCSVNNNATDKT